MVCMAPLLLSSIDPALLGVLPIHAPMNAPPTPIAFCLKESAAAIDRVPDLGQDVNGHAVP
jgi:hypothetical protein